MRSHYQKHPVQPPHVPDREALTDTSGLYATLYSIEPVSVRVVFDKLGDAARVELINPKSSALFDLFKRTNLERGTIIDFTIRGKAIEPAALARLNYFVTLPGYTKGFRAWRMARESAEGGITLWKSAPAWSEFKTLLNLSS